MPGSRNRYVFDASSWISIEGNPAQNRILFCLGKLIEEGRIISPPQSWAEVKKAHWVKAWLESHKETFIKRLGGVDFLKTVGQVTHRFPTMAGARRRKERADQYVLATAVHLNGTSNPDEHVVVCEESDAHRPSRKLVTACRAFKVKSMTLMDVLREEFPDEVWP